MGVGSQAAIGRPSSALAVELAPGKDGGRTEPMALVEAQSARSQNLETEFSALLSHGVILANVFLSRVMQF